MVIEIYVNVVYAVRAAPTHQQTFEWEKLQISRVERIQSIQLAFIEFSKGDVNILVVQICNRTWLSAMTLWLVFLTHLLSDFGYFCAFAA